MRYTLTIIITIALLCEALPSLSQGDTNHGVSIDGATLVPVRIIDGDTIPNITLKHVVAFAPRRFRNRRQYNQYYRLIHNLKVVYPYSQIAKEKIADMDAHFQTLKTDRERSAYIKQVERELFDEFEGQLRKLTITQGRLLIKLIDRELGKTSYDLIRELRGGFSAVFWQAIARVFGSNLKTEFDSIGEDRLLNELILLHEQGLL